MNVHSIAWCVHTVATGADRVHAHLTAPQRGDAVLGLPVEKGKRNVAFFNFLNASDKQRKGGGATPSLW
jgi:hypothetical protein